MRVLILGGTVFLGRHTVEALLSRGHEVTLFHRGRHGTELFPELEKLKGDRDGDLGALAGRRWDAVVDTCGYLPRIVRQSASLLSPAVGRYVFISSISVYAGFETRGMDEESPLAVLADPKVEEITGETYGGLKVLCERAVEEECPGRTLVIRPGLIVGPYDPTDRFSYWPLRVARGDEMLAPDRPERGTQVIDVRDLAHWTVRMMEVGRTGIFNATGAPESLSFGRLLESSKKISRSDATFTWVDGPFLVGAGAVPWSEIPLWVPEEGEMAGFDAVSIDRALAEGLSFRPIEETIADTLHWAETLPADRKLKAGLDPAKEAEILARWHARGSSPV